MAYYTYYRTPRYEQSRKEEDYPDYYSDDDNEETTNTD